MDHWKWVNFISLPYFDLAYSSRIKRMNQLSRDYMYVVTGRVTFKPIVTHYYRLVTQKVM